MFCSIVKHFEHSCTWVTASRVMIRGVLHKFLSSNGPTNKVRGDKSGKRAGYSVVSLLPNHSWNVSFKNCLADTRNAEKLYLVGKLKFRFDNRRFASLWLIKWNWWHFPTKWGKSSNHTIFPYISNVYVKLYAQEKFKYLVWKMFTITHQQKTIFRRTEFEKNEDFFEKNENSGKVEWTWVIFS